MSNPLFDLLNRLDEDRVHYSISRHRPESVLITATFVGERLEIDYFEDGHFEFSRFQGSEDVEGEAPELYQLLDEKKRQDT